jgi:hypothetical protein
MICVPIWQTSDALHHTDYPTRFHLHNSMKQWLVRFQTHLESHIVKARATFLIDRDFMSMWLKFDVVFGRWSEISKQELLRLLESIAFVSVRTLVKWLWKVGAPLARRPLTNARWSMWLYAAEWSWDMNLPKIVWLVNSNGSVAEGLIESAVSEKRMFLALGACL